jgi:predicted metal-dependent hydrolase
MQVRYPEFDLSDSVPHWGDNVEACTVINAGGIIPPPIERYLIKLMREVRELLDPVADATLIREVDIFCKQEAQHYRMHDDYLEMLVRGGYPRIREFEAGFEADLEEFRTTRDLQWNLAYGEGFESSGPAMAEAWLDGHVGSLCGDHGSVPMQLWMWHLAEEFEHRTVVHDVLHRLYGPERSFELRTTVGAFARGHYGEHAARAAAYLYEVDRAAMTEQEIATSIEREADTWLAYGALFGDRLNWIHEPDYSPVKVPAPADYATVLAAYSCG